MEAHRGNISQTPRSLPSQILPTVVQDHAQKIQIQRQTSSDNALSSENV